MINQDLQNINNSNIEIIETLKNEADDAIQINKDVNIPIIENETEPELKNDSILKPKKPRTEKQILAFQKATETRLNNLKERTELREIENEKLKIETEAKIIKKAKALERKQLKSQKPKIKITRLGSGLPVGADLEYADDVTLQRAMDGRTDAEFFSVA